MLISFGDVIYFDVFSYTLNELSSILVLAWLSVAVWICSWILSRLGELNERVGPVWSL